MQKAWVVCLLEGMQPCFSVSSQVLVYVLLKRMHRPVSLTCPYVLQCTICCLPEVIIFIVRVYYFNIWLLLLLLEKEVSLFLWEEFPSSAVKWEIFQSKGTLAVPLDNTAVFPPSHLLSPGGMLWGQPAAVLCCWDRKSVMKRLEACLVLSQIPESAHPIFLSLLEEAFTFPLYQQFQVVYPWSVSAMCAHVFSARFFLWFPSMINYFFSIILLSRYSSMHSQASRIIFILVISVPGDGFSLCSLSMCMTVWWVTHASWSTIEDVFL